MVILGIICFIGTMAFCAGCVALCVAEEYQHDDI